MLPFPRVHRSEQSCKALHNTDPTLPHAPLPHNGLAATPFAPSRVKLLLLHAGELLQLSDGGPLSLIQTILGGMDYQNCTSVVAQPEMHATGSPHS